MKKSLFWLVWPLALVVMLACGGGGAGGGGGGNGGGFGFTPKPGQYIEFSNPQNSSLVDPLNLQVGDTVQMVLANYDAFGNRTTLAASGWSVSIGASSFSINPSTGLFTVLSNPGTFFKFRTTTLISGVPTLFEQNGFVPFVTSTVNGRVVELGVFTGLPTNTGIPYIDVEFFNIGGSKVGAARTNGTGNYSARVPTTATHMMVLAGTIKTSHYFNSIYFRTLTYTPLDTACRVPVDPLGGGVNNIGDPLGIPTQAGPPPPPPDGCP